jgi:hypothetical protein
MQLGWDLSILVGPARLHLDTQRVTPPPGARHECELEREREKDGWKKVHRPAPSAIYRIHERALCYAHFTSRGQQLFPFYTLIEYGHVCGCGGARTQPDRDVSPAEFAFRTLLRCANQKSEMRPRDIGDFWSIV